MSGIFYAGRIPWTTAFVAMIAAACSSSASTLNTLRQAGGDFGVSVLSYKELPFRTVVRQQRDFSCGSAALATLLDYHLGRKLTEADIFKQMYAVGDQATIKRVGFSLLDMKRYLHTLGYEADGYRVPIAALLGKSSPSIVVMKSGEYKHFVVLKGIRDGKVLIGDPAFGLRSMPVASFERGWDGVVFLIHQPVQDAALAFNRKEDWRQVTPSNPGFGARQEISASALTRDLPPIYQLTPLFTANPR